MFFKKKKPKLDAKVRFQHKQFTSKLGSARSYRRQARPVPETGMDRFLDKIGLSSKWMQVLVAFAVLIILYLVYIPNFLSLKNIRITGLSETQTKDFENAILDQIASTHFYAAQHNLVFFNEKLVSQAASKLTSINSIDKINKNYKTQTLEIVAQSKYEKFLVATPEKVYDIYNDGVFKSEAGVERSNWENVVNPSMIKVQLYQNTNAENGKQFFDPSLLRFMDSLQTQFTAIDNLKFAYFSFKEPQAEVVVQDPNQAPPPEASNSAQNSDTQSITEQLKPIEKPTLELPLNSSEVHAVFYKDTTRTRTFRVIFDSTKDPSKAIANFKLLLSQTSPERFNQLSYIDLRIDSKAFICLLNTPCNN